jgi:signal transduction histidine kinase/CheY-like chemotaxis protein
MGLVSRHVSRPLRSLTKAAQKISAGNFALRLEANTRDEVGELTESFNVMTAYLLESRRVIEQHTEKLESLVAERTLELSRKNEELLLQTHRAEEANRLKTEFLANMSHELRTPLSSIIGFLSLILEGICDDENERTDLLKDAHRSSLHLLSLINYLLDLTKIEAGRLEVAHEPVDMVAEFREVERLMGVQAKTRSLELTFHAAEGLPDAFADAERVRQILINLIGNAIKFTHEGAVSVRAYKGDYDTVVVEVADTGIGIAKEKQAALFQKFTQVDGSQTRRYGGTGLGLALSKSLVELMSGTIELASDGDGRGTRIWFTLPAIPADEKERARVAADAQGILADSDPTAPLVLVVEDDPAFARHLQRVLRSGGFRAITARTADDACRLAEEMRPIAMTVDLGLPRVPDATLQSGVDLVVRATSFAWDCKTIVITGKPELAQDGLPAEGPDRNPIPLLRKPISSQELLRHLQRMPACPANRSRKILVADDDDATAVIVERFTRNQGTTVVRARNGVDALGFLREGAGSIDLVLLDLDMPELDGFGVLREVARFAPGERPEVLVVTNYPELATGRDGHLLRAGHVWGVISKSRLGEDPDTLNRALARISRDDGMRSAVAAARGA